MERYVNDGSPSGYSFDYSSSAKYSPLSGTEKFSLPVLWSENVRTYGIIPLDLVELFSDKGKKAIPFHPDNIDDFKAFRNQIKTSLYEVSPSASPRTLFSEAPNLFYLKLHYKGVLGRIERSMPIRKSMAEIEISKLLIDEVISSGKTSFGIFHSPFCNYYNDDKGTDFSFILRLSDPFPRLNENPILIPCFSLFSTDIKELSHPPLLLQILQKTNANSDWFLSNLIFPVLRMYIHLCKIHGLIPEINAQNLVYEFDDKFNCLRPVIRDFMEIEKDLSIRGKLNLRNNFDSINYKTIVNSDEDYFIRHSFSFDFKLTHYVIVPLAKLFSRQLGIDLNKLLSEIRDFVFAEWGQEIHTHFQPFDKWYDVPNRLLVNKSDRKYNINTNPILR